ncbi:hypothetical protein BKA70DRAFT_1131080, partial [Coprinopsis sp. MPI-PUGE-AT-0042]
MNPPTPPPIHPPTRYERGAPTWDKQASTLHYFLRKFDEICADYCIPEDKYLKHITHYLPSSEIELWKVVYANLEPEKRTWSAFLDEIYDLYPGSSNEQRWTTSDLDQLIELTSAQPMTTEDEFARYLRKFLVISRFLVSKGTISNREASRDLLSGFPFSLRQSIRQQLRFQRPLHDSDDPWPMEEVRSAARIVL